jgi:ribosome-associated protein
MKNDLPIKNGIVIPDHELEITASRSGGPGGQHVNKTSSKITIRWNVNTTQALNEFQKARVREKLSSRLTTEGDLIVHSSSSRSQQDNKRKALETLAHEVRKALYVPKKRMATRVSKGVKEARLQAKSHRSSVKKMRSKKYDE